jgi:pimeloyl-ACP methyl ester carboxylesterase
VVWGRNDAWVPLTDADRFLAAVPSARKVVLERCGHMPQEELPDEVVALLERFLTDAPAGA